MLSFSWKFGRIILKNGRSNNECLIVTFGNSFDWQFLIANQKMEDVFHYVNLQALGASLDNVIYCYVCCKIFKYCSSIAGLPSDKMAEGGTPNDASVLRPAIQIGSRGIAQILKIYQAGTEEIRKLLTQECEVIFECKVCRSLFRGLPNLIAHKRAYCLNEYVEQRKEFPNFYSSDVVTVMPEAPMPNAGGTASQLVVQTGPTTNQKPAKNIPKTNLVPLLSPSGKSSAWLKPKNTNEKESKGTTKGQEVVIIDVDGENEGENISQGSKVIPAKDREMLMCSTCNKKFTTMNALVKHYNHTHFGQQLIYKCPYCPSNFTYQRSCRRHLEKKHNKNALEANKIMKTITRKASKVSRKLAVNNSSPPKVDKSESKMVTKTSPPGVPEVVGTEAKSNSNPEESAALTSKVVASVPAKVVPSVPVPPVKAPQPEPEETIVREKLTCPDCGKEFEKRSILDRHMKVCADYAKIAVTFDMSLVKGMQHLISHGGTEKTSDSEGSPGKKRGRKGAPSRVTTNVVDSDVESIASERSSRVDSLEMVKKHRNRPQTN